MNLFQTLEHTINMYRQRKAFSIIEILVSVAIIAYAIIFVLKIHSENHEQIIYISERNKQVLEDSLYGISKQIRRYDKSTKSAGDLLHTQGVRPDELVSREVLKQSKRTISVPEEVKIIPPPDVEQASGTAQEIKLKGDYHSSYWHITIRSF
jgi:competence protein ComGC